jgi:hypothetical protein
MHPEESGMRLREIGILVLLLAAAVAFWDTAALYPVKAFVVLLHELGHALAAVLTGGQVERIELSSDLGGVCWSRGGWRLIVLPAGYLGSMLFGGLILLSAARSLSDRLLAAALGLAVLALTIVFVRSLFGIAFGFLFGAALVASARWLPGAANDLLLRFLGLASILYAAIDIKEDLISRTVPGSDAYAMSRELFLPPVFWGVLWMGLAVVAAGVFLYLAARSGQDAPAGTPGAPPSLRWPQTGRSSP